MGKDYLTIDGYFEIEIYRHGKLIDKFVSKNTVVNEGKMYLLRRAFAQLNETALTFYVGLKGSSVAISETDTATNALGANGSYNEITIYAQTTRPTYVPSVDTSNPPMFVSNHNNPATFDFNMPTPVVVYGAFLVSSPVKGSNQGILLSATNFQTPKQLSDGDSISIRYTIRVAP